MASTAVTCNELEMGTLTRTVSATEEPSLDRLRVYASHVLEQADDPPVCVCAPMFGTRRRYMAIRTPEILHLWNPVVDPTWTGDLPDGRLVAVQGKSIVTESQRMLFPSKLEAVENVRLNAIRLTYRYAK